MDPKGLEPSRARVRAAASATRGSRSIARNFAVYPSASPRSTLSVRRSISFVSVVCYFQISVHLPFERRTSLIPSPACSGRPITLNGTRLAPAPGAPRGTSRASPRPTPVGASVSPRAASESPLRELQKARRPTLPSGGGAGLSETVGPIVGCVTPLALLRRCPAACALRRRRDCPGLQGDDRAARNPSDRWRPTPPRKAATRPGASRSDWCW